jgi:PAS domain-containing protein
MSETVATNSSALVSTIDTVRWREERYRTMFDLGPVAIYSCDASGVIQEFNKCAADLWGSAPAPGDTDQRFCGSFKLFHPDGRVIPHQQCPMAEVVAAKHRRCMTQKCSSNGPMARGSNW